MSGSVRCFMFKFILFLVASLAVLCLWGAAASADSRSVVLDVQADNPLLKAGESHTVVVRVLVTPDKATQKKRIPLAVALVLDKSGSMRAGDKMENAKRGAMEAIRMLDERDIAALVVYDDRASIRLPARAVSSPAPFQAVIDAIRPGGSTALHDGVQAGAPQRLTYQKHLHFSQ